uniref:Uncharacterized protein n=1 Tax=Picea sitchensis TaxID=3332 RepID=A9NRJ6_PICSI|nr:unknown [Picea sitchensis]
MDVGVSTTMAKAGEAIHVASLCGLLPLETEMGRLLGKSQSSQIQMIKRRATVKAASSGGNQSGPGGPSSVDAELIVLRKRIHELRRQERNYAPPQHWMKWEKDWSVTYASDVCEAAGWLQNKLINTRPSITIASLALISLSVPVSLVLLLSRASGPVSSLAMAFLNSLHAQG